MRPSEPCLGTVHRSNPGRPRGGYVGQTALKTAELIERTRPGVLFIDEAYSLTPTHHSDFGAEAIAALVKAMEDHRGDFAVIMAGYSDEMADLVASNPGLRSRFKTFISFPTTPRTSSLASSTVSPRRPASPRGRRLEKAQRIFASVVGGKDFGNARFARSLFEESYARMSARAAADGVVRIEELTELTLEDVEWDHAGSNARYGVSVLCGLARTRRH